MVFEDRTLECSDCGLSFTFTSGEQEFYSTKGFTNEPRRCPDCRRARKNDRGGFGGPREPREMHSATCAECGTETQVPFRPRGIRPVYCNDCFSRSRA